MDLFHGDAQCIGCDLLHGHQEALPQFIGRDSNVYPLSCVRGVVPANSIYKTGGVIAVKR